MLSKSYLSIMNWKIWKRPNLKLKELPRSKSTYFARRGKIQAAAILYFSGIYQCFYQKLHIELIEYSLRFLKDFRATKSVEQLKAKVNCLKKWSKANRGTFKRECSSKSGTSLSEKAIWSSIRLWIFIMFGFAVLLPLFGRINLRMTKVYTKIRVFYFKKCLVFGHKLLNE